jgi:hypothetical protein
MADVESLQFESIEEKCKRYELALKLIRNSTLNGQDYGDFVQGVVDDVLDGYAAECPECGTDAHEGECVRDEVAA